MENVTEAVPQIIKMLEDRRLLAHPTEQETIDKAVEALELTLGEGTPENAQKMMKILTELQAMKG